MSDEKSNQIPENVLKSDLIPENDELNSNEYLGTFRWKRSLKFPVLPKVSNEMSYTSLTKWGDFINNRLTSKTFEPYIIDALSYPISIIYAINSVIQLNEYITKEILEQQDEINILILGASNKTECRIAMESNYFDEIYYFFNELTNNKNIRINLYFVGEEVKTETESYKSNSNPNLVYNFCHLNTGDFLKEYVMNFNKNNTFIMGMNCGFGAGYMKLTKSWFPDLIKLIKLKFITIFTYTNDFEDKPGEQAIIKMMGGNIVFENKDNPFKSMTTYTSEENDKIWACGNYGFYVLYGGDRKKVMEMGKLKDKEIEDKIKSVIKIK